MRGAFQARGRIPTAVTLIDDVYTTGSTCAAAASALRAGGARRIEVITFARAVR
jgi:predicted amidophosphoribosyltransferase